MNEYKFIFAVFLLIFMVTILIGAFETITEKRIIALNALATFIISLLIITYIYKNISIGVYFSALVLVVIVFH